MELVLLTAVALGGFAATVITVHLTISLLAKRDAALLAKLAELALAHMPVGEPMSIVQKKLELQANRENEAAKLNAARVAALAQKMTVASNIDVEQD